MSEPVGPDLGLCKSDFADHPWEEAISASAERTCFAYSTYCTDRASREEGVKRLVWIFLARVTILQLRPETTDEPFGPPIDDFADCDIDLLIELTPEVSDAELRARMADIIWCRRRGTFRFVDIAVRSYIESARILEHPEHWTHCEERAERALRLAASVRTASLYELAVQFIEEVLTRCNGEDPLYLSARMMSLFLEHKEGDASKYAPLAGKLAERAEAEEDYHRAKDYWDIKAKWHQRAGNELSRIDALTASAETHVRLARRALSRPAAPYMHAAGHLAHAIEAYRRIPGTKERVKEIHREMVEYQQKSVGELATFSSGPVDVSDIAQYAEKAVEGRQLHETLFAFAGLAQPAALSDIRELALEMIRAAPLTSFIRTTRLNAMGKVVAHAPSLRSSDPEQQEEAVFAKMFERLSFRWSTLVAAALEPARRRINLEHVVRLRDMLALVSNNPFVPPGREFIYARGLLAGFAGDFMASTHLLIPQIEHSVRYLLSRRDVITSGLDNEGIQDEFGLNRTLKESPFREKLAEILGEETVFELRGLLVERHGANLRNEMAHGLVDASGFYSYAPVYLWWLGLRLCCIPVMNSIDRSLADTSEGAPADAT